MILATTDELKQYISIADSFQFEDFQPYITKAVNTFTKKYVGNLHITLQDQATGDNADIKNQARQHLQNAIANFGWFKHIPFAKLIIDSSGISVSDNTNRKAASYGDIKDIRRECLQAGHEAMDLLLEVLEANPEVFTDYATNYSTVNNQLLVNKATIFSKYYNINDSRQVYLALQPTLRLVEDQYLKTFICPELINALKITPTDATTAQKELLEKLKEPLQKAMVAFTISKVASIGLFTLATDGLRLNFETYLDNRNQAVDYGLPAQQVKQLLQDQASNASIFLQQAKQIITDNLEGFTQCSEPLINNATNTNTYSSYDTTGVFGL